MHPKYWKPNRSHFLRAPLDSEGSMGAGGESSSLDTNQAADAFSSLFSGESQEESGATAKEVTETPESAAERLLVEDANQNSAEDGEKQPAESADDSTVEIEVDGKPVKLTKTELAEHYKNGLRQKDYTQKTMEVSEARKSAEAERTQAKAERDNYAQQLNNFAITSESILAEQAKALTEDLLRSDPVEYMALQRTFQERQANLAKAQQELQRINGERQQEHEQSAKAYQAEQLEKLQGKLPAFKDAVKAKAETERIKGYLSESPDLKFSMQEIGMFGDHRLVLLADKAQKYDALLERAKTTQATISKAPPKVERPGVAQIAATDGRTKAIQKLKSSGSISDAANAFSLLD